MTETYLREYYDEIDFNDLSFYNVFSIDFIREFRDLIDPQCTLRYGKNIPEKFLREMGFELDNNLHLKKL